jgi:hypothetical protein
MRLMISQEVIKYKPFHIGQKSIFTKRPKFMIARCGRRFGKTTGLEEIAAHTAAKGLKVGWFAPSYKLMIPTYSRIRLTLLPIEQSASKIDALIKTNTFGEVEFWSLDNEDAGRSRSYDLVIIDEGSLKKKGLRDVWEQAIKPTLLDRDGSAIMAGTPKGVDPENYFYVACTDAKEGWIERHAPTWDNPTLNQAAVSRLKEENAPLVWQQEYAADFVDWSGSAFFALTSLLVNGVAPEPQMHPTAVFAVIDTAVKGGKEHDGTAVTYFAVSKHTGIPLLILDYDMVQIEGSLLENWLPQVYLNLNAFAKQLKAINGSLGCFIEDKAAGTILIKQAQRRGWAAYALDSKLTAVGKDERSISVSGYVWQGMVKLTRQAYQKVINFKGVTKNHLVAQVCGYRIGVKDQADDLHDTFTYGISIALGDSRGY